MAVFSKVASLRIPYLTQLLLSVCVVFLLFVLLFSPEKPLLCYLGKAEKYSLGIPNSLRKFSPKTNSFSLRCEQKGRSSSVVGGVANNVIPSGKAQLDAVKRKDFPSNFMFGASTSALQTEGSGTEGGRGPSSWDRMINDPTTPEPDKGADSYNKYKEDIKALKDAGLNAYRMSISWSRLLPKGKISGGINQEGIDFYNNFFQELLDNGITPIVTLFHFDLPQALLDAYRGLLSNEIVNDFKEYADLCFKSYGDKVKHWTTINEPQVYASRGFSVGLHPPANMVTDPFIVGHNIILCHAKAAKHYKQNYQVQQGGQIGFSVVGLWFLPFLNLPSDQEAAERARDFMMAWMMDPLAYGDYPFAMRSLVREFLPHFTDEEKEMVTGSYDFIGLNYYTSRYTKHVPITRDPEYTSFDSFRHALESVLDKDGKPIGPLPPRVTEQFYIYPDGLKDVILYLKDRYSNPKIYITENGIPEGRNDSIPLNQTLQDDYRIDVITGSLYSVREAMKSGADVHGYFVWSLMDCMEVGSFYSQRFGLYYTDFANDYKRIPKKSAKWFQDFQKQ